MKKHDTQTPQELFSKVEIKNRVKRGAEPFPDKSMQVEPTARNRKPYIATHAANNFEISRVKIGFTTAQKLQSIIRCSKDRLVRRFTETHYLEEVLCSFDGRALIVSLYKLWVPHSQDLAAKVTTMVTIHGQNEYKC